MNEERVRALENQIMALQREFRALREYVESQAIYSQAIGMVAESGNRQALRKRP